jgi:hypothetical protein
MPPDEPNPEEQQEELSQDYQTPFSPPSDVGGATSAPGSAQTSYPTDPATDTNIQEEELYDEGPYGAAELPDPDVPHDVIGYHPEQRKDHPPVE